MVVVLLIGLARRSDTQCDRGELLLFFFKFFIYCGPDSSLKWPPVLEQTPVFFVIKWKDLVGGYQNGFPEETIIVCLICGYIELHSIQYVFLFIPGSLIELSSFLSILIVSKRSVSLYFKAETILLQRRPLLITKVFFLLFCFELSNLFVALVMQFYNIM